MDIGKPLREIIIEPVPDSLPEREAPAIPAESPVPDREPVPA